jgi:hypothetical protein
MMLMMLMMCVLCHLMCDTPAPVDLRRGLVRLIFRISDWLDAGGNCGDIRPARPQRLPADAMVVPKEDRC